MPRTLATDLIAKVRGINRYDRELVGYCAGKQEIERRARRLAAGGVPDPQTNLSGGLNDGGKDE